MSGTEFKDRLTLDEANGQWFDQTRRYMTLRPEALMGIFRNLPEPARRQALDAFRASIVVMGADSARAYRAMGGSADALVEIVQKSAPQLGWGVWRFERGEGVLRLTVRNSPFAAGFGKADYPVCHAIVGMIEAVAEMVFEKPVEVVETACAAMGAPDCIFEARIKSTQ